MSTTISSTSGPSTSSTSIPTMTLAPAAQPRLPQGSLGAPAPSLAADCYEDGVSWRPLNMLGAAPFLVAGHVDCQAACAETWRCSHWTFWPSSAVCNLQNA